MPRLLVKTLAPRNSPPSETACFLSELPCRLVLLRLEVASQFDASKIALGDVVGRHSSILCSKAAVMLGVLLITEGEKTGARRRYRLDFCSLFVSHRALVF